MSLLDTRHKKKSMTITVILYSLILLLLFFVGMEYLDPPPEQGIAVNFGTSNVGSGTIQPTEKINAAPKETTPPPVPQEKTEIKEEVVTQDAEDAPVIKQEEEKVEKVETPIKEEPTKEEPVEDPVPDPTPDTETTNALDALINGPKSDGTAEGGEGNDNEAGDKGDPNGDPNATSYYGTGKGLDGDGNYRLGGRKALNKDKKVPDCNETGVVVVDIIVNRQGQVVSAVAGVSGSTNTHRCLTSKAKAAALATKFNPDEKAPSKQSGQISYRFSLSQ